MSEAAKTPAFPVPSGAMTPGVDRRDWFAAMALQGVVAKGLEVMGDRVLSDQDRFEMLAQRAYDLADAMLHISQQTPTTTA